MANYRVPGPICAKRQSWSINDGTLARWLMPPLGPVCGGSSLYPTICPSSSRILTNESDVGFLFRLCVAPAAGLCEADYSAAATSLDVEIAAIRAVAEVESSGSAFDDCGRPRILFERHYFHRLTAGKYDTHHPDISNSTSGGYSKFSAQYGKLERAYALDPDAALRSASWGRFQIMGDNYKAAGFASVGEFVRAMTKSESEHLKAFVNFVGSHKTMLSALRNKDWPGFAAAYNGPRYKENNYDAKLGDAYGRFKLGEAEGAARRLP
jgi:hypothetical protein